MIYEVQLKDNTLLCDAMDIMSKLGDFVFADMRLYIHSEKNIIKNKKIANIAETIELLDYEKCSKLCNNMVRQFCLDKMYQEQLKKIEQSPEGQKKIMEVFNFLTKMEELQTKGAVEIAKDEENEGSASEIACDSDN